MCVGPLPGCIVSVVSVMCPSPIPPQSASDPVQRAKLQKQHQKLMEEQYKRLMASLASYGPGDVRGGGGGGGGGSDEEVEALPGSLAAETKETAFASEVEEELEGGGGDGDEGRPPRRSSLAPAEVDESLEVQQARAAQREARAKGVEESPTHESVEAKESIHSAASDVVDDVLTSVADMFGASSLSPLVLLCCHTHCCVSVCVRRLLSGRFGWRGRRGAALLLPSPACCLPPLLRSATSRTGIACLTR